MAASLFGTGGVINANVQGSLVPQVFTATAGQTLFTLTAFTYSVGTGSLLVFINGSLQSLKDYAETSTGSFTLVEACLGGESILALGFPETTLDYNGVFATLASPAAGKGASLLGSEDAGGYFAATSQEGINQEVGRRIRSVLSGFSAAERTDALSGTPTIDTTTKVQAAIDAAATAGDELIWEGAVLTGLLSSSSASIRWRFKPGAKILQKVAVYASNSWHVTLSGAGVVVDGIELDGNQSAMTNSTYGCNGLNLTGTSPTLLRHYIHDCNGIGYQVTGDNVPGLRRGLVQAGTAEKNAGLGLQTIAASYVDFFGCWHDRNGYGFKKTRANYADTSHGFVAFGVAVRLRSHHITFIGGGARDNGRDGININQGSYAVKHIGCLAHGNDDGGFTIASDNTGSGLPGEGEGCFDLEYIDCEAYNNYGGGLVAYQPAHNVTVSGGRYYNNHRLAGNQATASSYRNGIYFAAGSTGLTIDAKAYDERQSRVITAAASGVLTATGWVTGSMLYYPKVAIYSGSDWSFKGYGKITAESAGSVTISTTANNGVTLASISAGDYVTQATQHAGVFFDNNCQGSAIVDGWGHMAGPADGGRDIVSGSYSAGQNILLPKYRADDLELIANPHWDGGTGSWTYSTPGGGSATQVTSGIVRSAGALRLIAGTSIAQGDAAIVSGALAAAAGEFVELGVWCYASARGDATLYLYWVNGATMLSSVTHPGGGWRFLRIGAFIPASATSVFPRVESAIGKTTYWDSASLRAIRSPSDPREFAGNTRSLPL